MVNMNNNQILYKHFGDSDQEYSTVINRSYFEACPNNYYNFKTGERLKDQSAKKIIKTSEIYFCEQVHKSNVFIIDEHTSNNSIPDCDGLITSIPNVFLAVRTADCYPVFIRDINKNVFAVAHSGREGSRLKIVQEILNILFTGYNSVPNDIFVEIGPGICSKHYQVNKEIYNLFKINFPQSVVLEDNDIYYLNIQAVILETLNDNNIPKSNIITNTLCTYENSNYFSYRRDKNNNRQINIMGMING